MKIELRAALRIVVCMAMVTICSVGCFKKVSFDAQYILRTWSQPTSGAELTPLTEVDAYIYVGDTTQWKVASYDDARQGKVTQKSTGESQSASIKAVAWGTAGNQWQMNVGVESYMVIVADRRNKIYCYRQQQTIENLSPLHVGITFRPWKKDKFYKDGDWLFFSEMEEESSFDVDLVSKQNL